MITEQHQGQILANINYILTCNLFLDYPFDDSYTSTANDLLKGKVLTGQHIVV